MTRSTPAAGPPRKGWSRRSTVIIAVAVLVPFAAVAVFLVGRFFWGTGTAGAADAPEPSTAMPRVQQYLRALHDRDRDAVRLLSPPGYVEMDQDIDARLHKYAGVQPTQAQVNLSRDIAPDVVSAQIQAVGPDGTQVQWTESLVWRDNAWWLLVGHGKSVGSRATSTATSTRSPSVSRAP